MLKIIFGILFSFILLISCTKGSDSANSGLAVAPLIKPIVEEATPAGLDSLSSSSFLKLRAADSNAQDALYGFFHDTFGGISGTTSTGYIATALGDLDSRISELNNRFQSLPDCMSNTATTVTVGVAGLSQTLSMKLQCRDLFSDGVSGSGSGMVWGVDGDDTYLGLLLVQSNGTDKFGYFAKVNSINKTVDMIFMEHSPTYSRDKIARLTTDAATSKVELVFAGTSETPGPSQDAAAVSLGCGVRLITSATQVLVDGRAGNTTSGGVCSTAGNVSYDFTNTNCYSATDLSAAAAACGGAGLSTSSFAHSLIPASSIPAQSANINTALDISSISGVTDI